jgi:hypothetical protein
MAAIKVAVVEFLRGQAVKLALKKLLGSAAMGGFKGWLIKLIVTELYDEIGEPVINRILNAAGYQFNRLEGKGMVRKIKGARNANDEEAYNDSVDTVFKR